MKKLSFISAFAFSVMLTSCYSYTTVVGQGAQGSQQTKAKNHYLIGGIVPVGVSDAKQLAGEAQNYTVKTEMSFVDGLLSAITGGIYTPTTTTVTK